MYGKISRLFISCSALLLALFALSWAGEGEFSANIPGTDVIFLSGRTDVVIPDLGAYGTAFPLLRHGYVLSDFLKETFPKAIAAKAGMIFKLSATGHVHYYNGPGYGSGFGPDGEAAGMSSLYALGGISGYKGPQGPLAGVFLDDANPALATPPALLDFWSTGLGTSFSTLSPMLGQVFFIGDGSAAGYSQTFIAPEGATRLYLAIPDGFGFVGGPGAYEDNDGSFSVQASYTLPDCAHSGAITQACFYDDFNDNSLNALLWATGVGGSGPSLSETNRSLEVVLPASSSNNGQTGFSGGMSSSCKLKGDFDIQVDYNLLTWPSANGVRVGLGTVAGPVERVSFGTQQDYPGWPREVYLTHFSDGVLGIVSTTDLSGKLRLVRTGNTATGYYYANGAWVPVHTGPSSAADTGFSFSAWSHDYAFTNQDVKTAFDNMIINKGELLCGNTEPVAGAGPDQTLDCAGPSGAVITLDGSGSSDVDGDTLTYTWTWNGGTASGVRPTVTLPYGETSVTLRVDDNNGGTDEDTVVIRVLDTVPPVTTLRSIIGTPGDNGWYKSDVTMTVDSLDACSGVSETRYSIDGTARTVQGNTATFAVTGDGVHEITFGATDNAGNNEVVQPASVKIDTTRPGITASISPLPNANGWYSTDVTVTFACSDATSGIALCPDPVLVTTEGADQTITVMAVDKAGNTASTSVTLNIDKTPPIADISLSPGMLWPPNHKMVNVQVNGGSIDSTSGVASVVFTVLDEYGAVQPAVSGFNTTIPLEAWRTGIDQDGRHYTITAVITDTAGNTSVVTTQAVCPHDMGKDPF